MVDSSLRRGSVQEMEGWGLDAEEAAVHDYICGSSTDEDCPPAGPGRDPGYVYTVLEGGQVPGPIPWARASDKHIHENETPLAMVVAEQYERYEQREPSPQKEIKNDGAPALARAGYRADRRLELVLAGALNTIPSVTPHQENNLAGWSSVSHGGVRDGPSATAAQSDDDRGTTSRGCGVPPLRQHDAEVWHVDPSYGEKDTTLTLTLSCNVDLRPVTSTCAFP